MRSNLKFGIEKVLTGRLVNGAFLCMVDFTKLCYLDYQRDVIKNHVKNLKDSWDWELASPVLVSLRDGHLNCIDGRQRATAAIDGAKTSGLAFIWDKWSYQRECKAFYVFNSVPKKMKGWKNFEADMKAGNDTNRRIIKTLHDMGLTTPFHPYVPHPDAADFSGCGILNEVVKKGGLPHLKLYATIVKGWKTDAVPETAKNIDFGRALNQFLFKNNKNQTEIIRLLKVIRPNQIRTLANSQDTNGRPDVAQIRQALESLTGLSKMTLRKAI